MHQKPRIPPRPKEDGVSCCMMDDTRLCFEKYGIDMAEIYIPVSLS